MKYDGRRMVAVLPLSRSRSSTERLARWSGLSGSSSGKERKTKRPTPADSAASTRLSCPCRSTVSIESPSARDSVELAVENTVSTPVQAAASELIERAAPVRAQIQARAVENGVYIVHANAPANDDTTGSHGQSRVIAPDGNLLAVT